MSGGWQERATTCIQPLSTGLGRPKGTLGQCQQPGLSLEVHVVLLCHILGSHNLIDARGVSVAYRLVQCECGSRTSRVFREASRAVTCCTLGGADQCLQCGLDCQGSAVRHKGLMYVPVQRH